MSADSTNACPACYARAHNMALEEVTQLDHLNEVEEDPGALREYHENYIDRGHVVFEYKGAGCHVCDYQIPAFTLRHPIPEIGE